MIPDIFPEKIIVEKSEDGKHIVVKFVTDGDDEWSFGLTPEQAKVLVEFVEYFNAKP